MSVKIITDSTADLLPQVAERLTIVPLTIRFGDTEYVQGVDITNEEFYEKLVESDVLPTTSQATPFAFEEVFQKAVDDGDDVVCITLSSHLSGTCQSATVAASEFPGRVFVVDSQSAAIGAGILTEYALQLAQQGLSAQEIAAELEKQHGIKVDTRKIDLSDPIRTVGDVQVGVWLYSGVTTTMTVHVEPVAAK